jgi:hypothetical protein
MQRLARRGFLAAAAGLLLVGCLSPTLPLPPPSRPDIAQVGTNEYQLTGTIPSPGFVLVLNKRTNVVNGELATEAYSIRVQAQPEDGMQLWYESGTDVSDIVEFDIPAPAPGSALPPQDAGTD